MTQCLKYLLVGIGFLVVVGSGVMALAHNFNGMMGFGCMEMMLHTDQPPNQQWRQRQ